LADFENNAKKSGVRVIFTEPQFSTAPIEPIARDLGIKLATLDPEGSASNATTYEQFIRYNVDAIVKAYTP